MLQAALKDGSFIMKIMGPWVWCLQVFYRFSLCLVGDAYQLMDMALFMSIFSQRMVPLDG